MEELELWWNSIQTGVELDGIVEIWNWDGIMQPSQFCLSFAIELLPIPAHYSIGRWKSVLFHSLE